MGMLIEKGLAGAVKGKAARILLVVMSNVLMIRSVVLRHREGFTAKQPRVKPCGWPKAWA